MNQVLKITLALAALSAAASAAAPNVRVELYYEV